MECLSGEVCKEIASRWLRVLYLLPIPHHKSTVLFLLNCCKPFPISREGNCNIACLCTPTDLLQEAQISGAVNMQLRS